MSKTEDRHRRAHYIRYKQHGRWYTALVETLDAKNELTMKFERNGTKYDYHGTVEIPEQDSEFIEE